MLQVSWPEDSANQSYVVRYHPTSTADLTQSGTWPTQSGASVVRLEGLEPFTNYSVVVIATTVCGVAYSSLVTGVTSEATPTAPLNVTVLAVLSTKVKVQWSSPASPNGIITHYNVSTCLYNVTLYMHTYIHTLCTCIITVLMVVYYVYR